MGDASETTVDGHDRLQELFDSEDWATIAGEAEALLDAAASDEQSDVAATVSLAHMRLGAADAARVWLDRAKAAATSAEALRWTAYVAWDLDVEESTRLCQEARQLAQSQGVGQEDDALTVALDSCLDEPKLGQLLERLEGDEGSPAHGAMAFLVSQGRYGPASRLLLTAEQAGHRWALAPEPWLALAANQEGDVAIELLVPRLDRFHGDARSRALWLLGASLLGTGRFDEALPYFREGAAQPGSWRLLADAARTFLEHREDDPTELFAAVFDWCHAHWDELDASDHGIVDRWMADLSLHEASAAGKAVELIGSVARDDDRWPSWTVARAVAMSDQDQAAGLLDVLDELEPADTAMPPLQRHVVCLLRMVALAGLGRASEGLAVLASAQALRADIRVTDPSFPEVVPADLIVLNTAGRWDELVTTARRLLDTDPSPPVREGCLWQIATGLVRSGEASAAVEPLRELAEVAVSPDDRTSARLAAAEQLVSDERADEALILITPSDLVDPGSTAGQRGWRLRFRMAESAGNIDGSIEALEALAPTDPDGAALLSLYRAIYRPGSTALSQLSEPTEPHTALGCVIAAQARATTGSDGAPELLEEARSLDPSSADWPMLRLTEAMLAAGAGDEAAVDQAIGGLNQPLLGASLVAQARAAAGKEPAEVIAAWDEVLAMPHRPVLLDDQLRQMAFLQKAIQLVGANRVPEAEGVLAESRQARISTPPAVAALEPLVESIIALRLDRADRASELLKDVPPELQNMFGPKFRAASLYVLGVAEEQQSNWEEARRAFQSSLALDPTVETLEALGDVELALQDPSSARRTLLEALSRPDGRTSGILISLSAAERQLDLVESAIERARTGLDSWPEQAGLWKELGRALAAAGRWDAALNAYDRALKHTTRADARSRLALLRIDTLLRLGRDADVLDMSATAGDRELDGKIAHYRAIAHTRRGEHAEALRALGQAARAPGADSEVVRQHTAASRQAEGESSWLSFWFGRSVSRRRRALGWALIALAVAITALASLDPKQVSWLQWHATGAQALAPLALVAVLFALPLVTNLKFGPFEVSLPAKPPSDDRPDLVPPDLDALLSRISRPVLGLSTTTTTNKLGPDGEGADWLKTKRLAGAGQLGPVTKPILGPSCDPGQPDYS